MTKEAINQRFIETINYILEQGIEKNKAKLADKIEIKASKLSEILGGRMNVPVETMVALCSYYHVSYYWLFSGKKPMFIHDIPYLSEPVNGYQSASDDATMIDESQEPEVWINKHGNKFLIYPTGTFKVEVLQIPFPAYASYLEVYDDEAAVAEEFGTATFNVDKPGKGYYLGFKVKGDSMNGGSIDDTPDGAQVLGREIGRHLWQDGFTKKQYGFILMTTTAIYHKDITFYNRETGMLTLSSRNKNIKDFEISINDVNRIFSVIKRVF